MKPSILIIADFPGWAYFEIQQFLKKNLSYKYDIYCDFLVFNTKVKSKNPLRRFKNYLGKRKYSELKKDYKYDIVLELGFYFEKHMKINWESRYRIKGIYTDGFPPSNSNFQGKPEEFINEFCANTDLLVCGSRQIKDFYSQIFPRVFYANGLIDDNFFIRRKAYNRKKFVIGWTGNPQREFKGYYSHVLKVAEILKLQHSDIELKSRFSGPMETLPDFYEDVDVVLIASDADAGPSMFGEASLMGVPSVSTNIGWPSQVIKNGVNGFIVEKEVDEMVEKIELLYNNRSLLEDMSNRIRTDYQIEFNTEDMVSRWDNIFKTVLEIGNE
ncbi:glycosyltransferase family 4 protein [Robertkochia flava]|uniref:glycosyltransferase family 4 protein n=1 Tax=Robertkochia flava TaxID=3447986 RepID=UPI001CCCF3D4|nr:glycosyltransferase family 4 protein [Robertkochia marina]